MSTVEEKLKFMFGDLLFEIGALQIQIEKLTELNKELTKELANERMSNEDRDKGSGREVSLGKFGRGVDLQPERSEGLSESELSSGRIGAGGSSLLQR
jgi:hypothetical protein